MPTADIPIPTATLPSPPSGVARSGGATNARHVGEVLTITSAPATLAAAVALATVQSPGVCIPRPHRIRGAFVQCSGMVAVAAGTDPSVDIYKHLPVPDAIGGAALISPAAAGNIEDGVHKYAVVFYNAAGSTTPSDTISVTVADKTTNGKVVLTGIPLGPTGTTGRKIYRTLAGASTLTLLTTIADNTTTTYTDNIADGSLSGAVPTANAARATILSAPLVLSTTGVRLLTDQPVAGTLSTAMAAFPSLDPTLYTLGVLTGASTGALTNITFTLEYEFLA